MIKRKDLIVGKQYGIAPNRFTSLNVNLRGVKTVTITHITAGNPEWSAAIACTILTSDKIKYIASDCLVEINKENNFDNYLIF